MNEDWIRLCELLDDDRALVGAVSLAVIDPNAYFTQHEQRLLDRRIESAAEIDPWLVLVDGLDEAGALAYLDWRDGAAELADALAGVPRVVRSEIDLEPVADVEGELAAAIGRADALLEPEGLRIIYLEEDSDAYPLVVVPLAHVGEIVAVSERLSHNVSVFAGGSGDVLVSFPPQQVLVSRWALSSLWWTSGSGWTWMSDRPSGVLSDEEVRGKYGDEAFRRRDLLKTSDERVFEPALAEMIGRRVVDAVSRGGWEVIADDARHFQARRGEEILEVNGDVSEKLRLTGAGDDVNGSRVDEAERWLLTAALGNSALSMLDEIVSVQGQSVQGQSVQGQRSTKPAAVRVTMGVRDARADADYFADAIANLDRFCASYDRVLASPPLEGDPTHAIGVKAGNAMKSRWARFSSKYSTGAPASAMRHEFEQVLAAAERAVRLEKQTIHEDLFVRRFAFGNSKDFYREWLCLVSIAIAFDVDDAMLDRVVSAVEIGWGDRLLDRLIRVRRPEHPLGDDLAFPRIVGPLDQAFDEPDAMKAQKLITRYLAKWYPSWKGIWGWGGHEFLDKHHYWGYWAFEAGGVVAALRLDDSSFRDNDYYPRDLVGL